MNFAVSLVQRATGIFPNAVVQPSPVPAAVFKSAWGVQQGFEITPKITMVSAQVLETTPTFETERVPEKITGPVFAHPQEDAPDTVGLSHVHRQDIMTEAITHPEEKIKHSLEIKSNANQIVPQEMTSLSPQEPGADHVSREYKHTDQEISDLHSGKGSERSATPEPDLSNAGPEHEHKKKEILIDLPHRNELRPAVRSETILPAESSPVKEPQIILTEKKTDRLEQRLKKEPIMPLVTHRLSGPGETSAKQDRYPLIEPKPSPQFSLPKGKALSAPPMERRVIQVRIGAIEIQANTPLPPAPQPVTPQASTSQGFDNYAMVRSYYWPTWD